MAENSGSHSKESDCDSGTTTRARLGAALKGKCFIGDLDAVKSRILKANLDLDEESQTETSVVLEVDAAGKVDAAGEIVDGKNGEVGRQNGENRIVNGKSGKWDFVDAEKAENEMNFVDRERADRERSDSVRTPRCRHRTVSNFSAGTPRKGSMLFEHAQRLVGRQGKPKIKIKRGQYLSVINRRSDCQK
jgi:hypothetical protein